MVVGIDVGARALHCVALDAEARALDAWTLPAAGIAGLPERLAGALAVAIDAPAATSTLPHAGDGSLAPKFRAARCAEVALGREHRIWVPWVSPAERPADGWIATGLAAFEALAPLGVPLLEVFPYAVFRLLAPGRPLPRKSSPAGRAERLARLASRGVADERLRGHDLVDAAACALVALDAAAGRARRVACAHEGEDGSAIWLPAGAAAA